jgi:hypothetical protein
MRAHEHLIRVQPTLGVRLVAFLTLLLIAPYGYYLITYYSYNPTVFHRYSPGYFLYLVLHGVLLLPLVSILFFPRAGKTTPAKSVVVPYALCWALLTVILVRAESAKVVFQEYGWLYSGILAVQSFFATGALLHLWNEKLFATWKAMASRAAVVGCGLFCAAAICEIALRLKTPRTLRLAHVPNEFEFFQYHPLLGWVNRPQSAGYLRTPEFDHPVRINRHGLNDSEYGYAKRPGTPRILCLGDSFTWGYGVEQDQRFSEVLENELMQGVEVINAGVSGYNTAQEWLWLRERGVKYRPDLVVLCFYLNDFTDNAQPAHGNYGRPLCAVEGGTIQVKNVPVPRKFYRANRAFITLPTVLSRTSYTYRLLQRGYDRLRKAKPEQDVEKVNTRLLNEQSFVKKQVDFEPEQGSSEPVRGQKITEALLNEIQCLCEKMGAKLLVVLIPERQEVRPHDPIPPFHPRAYKCAQEICEQNGFTHLDLRPLLAQCEQRGRKVYFDADYHWNTFGHRMAAEAIHRKIMEDGLLPTR